MKSQPGRINDAALRHRHLKACLAAGLTATTLTLAADILAQGARYPQRPVRMIVPLPAGGSTDILARIVAQKFTDGLGKTFIIDNRPGAGTSLGN